MIFFSDKKVIYIYSDNNTLFIKDINVKIKRLEIYLSKKLKENNILYSKYLF